MALKQTSPDSYAAQGAILQNMPCILVSWQHNPDYAVLNVSQGIETWWYAPEALLSGAITFIELIHPDDRERFLTRLDLAISATLTQFRQEFRIITADRRTVWISAAMSLTLSPDAPPTIHALCMDTSDSHQAELELRQKRQLIKSLLDAIPDAMIFKDEQCMVLGCNSAFESLFGESEQALLGRHNEVFLSSESQDWQTEIDRHILATGQSHQFEYLHVRTDGSRVLLDVCKTAFGGLDGKPIGIVTVCHDITHIRESEARLQQQDAWLRIAQNIGHVGLWEWRPSSGEMVLTAGYCRMLGYEDGEIPANFAAWQAMVHPDDLAALDAEVSWQLSLLQEVRVDEYRILRKNGLWCWVLSRSQVIEKDAAGRPTRIMGINLDISERKETESALQSSKQLLQSVIDNADAFVYACDMEGRLILANRALAQRFGTTIKKLIGQKYRDLLPPDIAREYEQNEAQVVQSGSAARFNEHDILADGQHAFLTSKFPLYDQNARIKGTGGISTDVTQLQRLEAEARQSADLLQHFLDHLPAVAYIKDEHLRVRLANQTFSEMLQLAPSQLLGRSNQDVFPGEFGRKVDEDDRRVIANRQVETIVENLGGRYYESTKFVLPRADGQFWLAGITMDVTERRREAQRSQCMLEINELAERVNETEFLQIGMNLLESLTGSSIGFLHFVNDDQETLQLSTWTSNTLAHCQAEYDNHYPISQAGIWADSFRIRAPVRFNNYASYPAKKGLPEGHSPLERLISIPVIEGEKVRVIMGVGNKVGDYDDFDQESVLLIGHAMWHCVQRARAEQALQQKIEALDTALRQQHELNLKLDATQNQLLQSEKMSAIGQLAAGVAHEINNPVGFVSSNLGSLTRYTHDLTALIDLLASQAGAPDCSRETIQKLLQEKDYDWLKQDVADLLQESQDGLARVRKIVQDLKDFSRSSEEQWDWADLHAGLESTLNIVWNELKYKAEIIREYGDLPPVWCVISQLNQVFMNLLVNAAHAIEAHGQITLRTGCAAEQVWIEIADTGKGIAPQNLKRIFDPFFTTKPVGQGTGLGLALAWGILEKHQGRIEVQSELGQGSCFRITLPIQAPKGGDHA